MAVSEKEMEARKEQQHREALKTEFNTPADTYQSSPQGRGISGSPYRPITRAERLENLFSYHPPTMEQRQRYEAIRMAARHFAEALLVNTPSTADQSIAMDLFRSCVMYANASIALEGKETL